MITHLRETVQTGHELKTKIIWEVFPSIAEDNHDGNFGPSSALKTFVAAVYEQKSYIRKVKGIDDVEVDILFTVQKKSIYMWPPNRTNKTRLLQLCQVQSSWPLGKVSDL